MVGIASYHLRSFHIYQRGCGCKESSGMKLTVRRKPGRTSFRFRIGKLVLTIQFPVPRRRS